MTKPPLAIAFVSGILLGGFATWAHTFGSSRTTDKEAPKLGTVLKFAAISISTQNDHCESRFGHTVGAVLGGILEAGLGDIRNPYVYSCAEGTCRIGIGNCAPWQTSDCGQTLLEFQLDPSGAPRPETFTCVDVP